MGKFDHGKAQIYNGGMARNEQRIKALEKDVFRLNINVIVLAITNMLLVAKVFWF